MRYTTMGLVDGTAVSLGKANKLSFWTKGLESRDNVIRVRVFAINQVTPSTQQDTSKLVEDVFTIEAGAGWTECVVDLSKSSHAAFYGVSIFPVKNNGDGSTSGNKYIRATSSSTTCPLKAESVFLKRCKASGMRQEPMRWDSATASSLVIERVSVAMSIFRRRRACCACTGSWWAQARR